MIHGACIGAGVDLITACDIRLCTQDSYYSVKEVDIGLAADLGSLQRLTKSIGNQSLVRELCFTGRKLKADEAMRVGLVSRVFEDWSGMEVGALGMAGVIVEKSPVAIAGTKRALIHARDHSVSEGLEYIANWNSAMLQSEDIIKAIEASLSKKPPKFSNL